MPDTDRTKPALALSGGGFRATLFHCGALIRLNELGLLNKIERFAGVSGGSIALGRLACQWGNLEFDGQGEAQNLDEVVIEPLRKFCRRNIDRASIGWGGLLPGKTIADVLADAYDEHLFDGTTLDQLPDKPQFMFKATNLQTGRLVRMSKRRIADYLIGEIPKPQNIRVAIAVAASSAFPPVLSPVVIKTKATDWRPFEGSDLHAKLAYKRQLVLTDGGVYDNIGLESIDTFSTVLISDAGAPFNFQLEKEGLWHKQVFRALDVATDQSRGLRKRLIFEQAKTSGQKIAYWQIDPKDDAPKPDGAIATSPGVTKKLASIRTRLNKFSAKEQGLLINWGYAACDNNVRLFIEPGAAPPAQLPVPKYKLD